MKAQLTTLQGPARGEIPDVRKLSDFEAGLFFLKMLDDVQPGFTWKDFLSVGNMLGCPGCAFMAGKCGDWDLFCKTQNLVGDVIDVIGDSANWLADKGGDLVRLATDEEVFSTVTRALTAYASGGGSEALKLILDNVWKMTPSQQQQVAGQMGISREELLAIAGTGKTVKEGGAWGWLKSPVTWVVGGIAGVSLVVLAVKKL